MFSILHVCFDALSTFSLMQKFAPIDMSGCDNLTTLVFGTCHLNYSVHYPGFVTGH